MSRWRRWIKKRRKKFARHCPLFFSTLPAFLLLPNCYFGGEIDPTHIEFRSITKATISNWKKEFLWWQVCSMIKTFHGGLAKQEISGFKNNLYSLWHIIDCWIQGEGHTHGIVSTGGCSCNQNSLRGITHPLMHRVQYFAQKLIGLFQ